VPFTRKILFALTVKKRSSSKKENASKTIDGEIIDHKKDDV
jgi:hypothetical protein